MNYKSLFDKIVKLLSSPGEAWSDLEMEVLGKKVVSDFVYPLIGLCTLSEFIGAFLGKDMSPELFQLALTRSCAIAVALFGGFYLASSLVEKVSRKFYHCYVERDAVQVFVGYSMSVLFVLDIVSGLFSIGILHWILQLYTFLVVFEGARRFVRIDDRMLTSYTIVSALIVLVSPAFIKTVFDVLSVLLN